MDESLNRLIRDAMPLAAELGFEGIEGGPEAVVLRGAWAPERCTAAGVLHGGYLMALADTAAGRSPTSTFPGSDDGHDRGQDELPRAVRSGFVTARAEPFTSGGGRSWSRWTSPTTRAGASPARSRRRR